VRDRTKHMTGVTLALAILSAMVVGPAAPAGAAGTIRPGMLIQLGNVQCTANFVYNGTGAQAGNVYLGTAAHCAEKVGQQVSDGRGHVWGTVAFIGNANDIATDFAFIRVLSGDTASVRAGVAGHPSAPKGVAAGAGFGSTVLVSGYGLTFRPTSITREQRRGLLLSENARVYQAEMPIFFGDSGGPVVQLGSNRALGIVSVICLGLCGIAKGPTVSGILHAAAARGFHVRLRTT
jgi:Trypsin